MSSIQITVQTMRTALYYPHTKIQKESLLRTALLLWDRIEVIVPWPEFRPHYQDRSMAEAFELIGHAHFPSEKAKAETHKKVLEFIDAEILSPFLYKSDAPGYSVYSGKLLPEPGASSGTLAWPVVIRSKKRR